MFVGKALELAYVIVVARVLAVGITSANNLQGIQDDELRLGIAVQVLVKLDNEIVVQPVRRRRDGEAVARFVGHASKARLETEVDALQCEVEDGRLDRLPAEEGLASRHAMRELEGEE